MRVTKEKVLAAICALIGVFVLTTVRSPAVEAVPEVPAEESARAFRTLAVTPRLAPEGAFSGRDPFRTHDPWQEAAPATLAVPPRTRWPRALPGGLEPLPRSPRDRVLVTAEPQPAGAEAPR